MGNNKNNNNNNNSAYVTVLYEYDLVPQRCTGNMQNQHQQNDCTE